MLLRRNRDNDLVDVETSRIFVFPEKVHLKREGGKIRKAVLVYVRRKIHWTFGDRPIGGYLTTCLRLRSSWDRPVDCGVCQNGVVSGSWRICPALRLPMPPDPEGPGCKSVERAIGIYSSLFAEQVLGLTSLFRSWNFSLG